MIDWHTPAALRQNPDRSRRPRLQRRERLWMPAVGRSGFEGMNEAELGLGVPGGELIY